VTAFGHFLLGSHNLMVTALGSCVKWPLVKKRKNRKMPTSLLASRLELGNTGISTEDTLS
jgi:hypothetical protein